MRDIHTDILYHNYNMYSHNNQTCLYLKQTLTNVECEPEEHFPTNNDCNRNGNCSGDNTNDDDRVLVVIVDVAP